MVRWRVGWSRFGAISAKGVRTKARSCMAGWGRVRASVWRVRFS